MQERVSKPSHSSCRRLFDRAPPSNMRCLPGAIKLLYSYRSTGRVSIPSNLQLEREAAISHQREHAKIADCSFGQQLARLVKARLVLAKDEESGSR